MITYEQRNQTRQALDFARKNGCQAVRAMLYAGTSSAYEVRDMKIDRLSEASESSLRLQLFVDGRYGSYSTNRLEKDELEKFILDSISATRFLTEDRARCLPDAGLYYMGGGSDLHLLDPTYEKVQPDEKIRIVMRACAEMTGHDKRLVSATTSYGDERVERYLIDTNGFEGSAASSSFSLSAEASIRGEGEARPEAYWFDSSLFFDKLQKNGIGSRALERALQRLGQRKVASGKYAMLVDNLNAPQLVAPLINALYGSSIQQKNSFLLGKKGQQVLGRNIRLSDEPHLCGAVGARYFDNEGVATREMPVFEEGVLKNYYIDTYYAGKLDLPQTVDSPSVLRLEPGDKDLEGLLASVDKGILVTGFNGGNSNSSTGDFSYGVEGFLIEHGRLAQPVNEMNITGNFISLWNRLLAAGNDPHKAVPGKIPSLLFDGVDFSGL
ncbi:MAG: TldD/PmbA family protein [Tannerella sp.]|jgi:PmbA protein|nr:TldD/PmbA family protein [Tannerella sp.]